MTIHDLATVKVSRDGATVRAVIDNPPLNLLDFALMRDLDRLAEALEADPDVHVVVFTSADPELFVAHGDMSIVSDPDAFAELPVGANQPSGWNPMMRLHERIRQLPQITVGVLRGLARGGGSEFLAALDLRYGSLERAGLAQMETPTGIIPGAGATAYLPGMIGRSRALETILTARLVDAATAERWGWLTRAVPDVELDEVVDAVVSDIASLPDGVARGAKRAVAAAEPPLGAALSTANEELGRLFDDTARGLTTQALRLGAQTREGEQDLEQVLRRLRRLPERHADGRR